jgi:glycosyltransferase involved in cell wall biosynthesis
MIGKCLNERSKPRRYFAFRSYGECVLNILFFQYGDFGEAYRRFQEGGLETYRDQRASVDFVASLRSRYVVTTVAICDRDHRDDLDNNLRSIGISQNAAYRPKVLFRLFNDIQPDIIVCRTPNYHAIRWAKLRNVPTLLSFADFFSNRNPRQLLRNVALRALLDPRVFPCVSNHNLNACISVSRALFYPKSRVVPWDWIRLRADDSPKSAPTDVGSPLAFFAGALTEAKGVGDCLEAVALLKNRGINLIFEFAGPGDVETWRTRALQLEVGDRVQFLGLIPNTTVRQRMIASDIIVVPSRHDYPEGLPNTIYEALASRTPLVISDHPAFANRLQSGEDCLVFRAADASSLADRITSLLTDNSLFARLSTRSAAALNTLFVGMNWTDLVSTFLTDPHNRTGWVQANSLVRLEGGSKS